MGRGVGPGGHRVQAIFYIVIGQKLILQECATTPHPLSLSLATVSYTGYPPPLLPPFGLPGYCQLLSIPHVTPWSGL